MIQPHSRIPRVNEVLELIHGYEGVDPVVLYTAAKRGTLVHKLCALDDQNQLDIMFVDIKIRPYVRAWRAFLWGYRAEITGIELPFMHKGPGHKYRSEGIDRIAIIDDQEWILDIKTVSQITAALKKVYTVQLAAYARAVASNHVESIDDVENFRAGIVHLRKNGTYKLYDQTHHMQEAGRIFVGLLEAWHAINNFKEFSLRRA